MTTITAEVVADSVNEHGNRLTTLQLRYPLVIHAELMTHRVLSRNARSSRAVPVSKLIEEVLKDPFVPLFWGKNQPGMRAGEDHDAEVLTPQQQDEGGEWFASKLPKEKAWLKARDMALYMAESFERAGYHKQIVNRLLAPFLHIDVLVTATEWDNFFSLRIHPAAEPHMRLLAERMKEAMDASKPARLEPGQWHLPYVSEDERVSMRGLNFSMGMDTNKLARSNLIKLSIARCARISYKPFDSCVAKPTEDIELADRLLTDRHMSPFEHQATPDETLPFPAAGRTHRTWVAPDYHGNFNGFIQYRKVIENA